MQLQVILVMRPHIIKSCDKDVKIRRVMPGRSPQDFFKKLHYIIITKPHRKVHASKSTNSVTDNKDKTVKWLLGTVVVNALKLSAHDLIVTHNRDKTVNAAASNT